MKRIDIILLAVTMFMTISCNHQGKKEYFKVTGKPGIFFETTEFNFDTLDYRQEAVHLFEFKNNGDQPLLITKVTTSCGCTASEYSDKPYMSDSTGFIKVRYDTRRTGKFNKTIYVNCNAEKKPVELKISGIVRDKDKETE